MRWADDLESINEKNLAINNDSLESGSPNPINTTMDKPVRKMRKSLSLGDIQRQILNEKDDDYNETSDCNPIINPCTIHYSDEPAPAVFTDFSHLINSTSKKEALNVTYEKMVVSPSSSQVLHIQHYINLISPSNPQVVNSSFIDSNAQSKSLFTTEQRLKIEIPNLIISPVMPSISISVGNDTTLLKKSDSDSGNLNVTVEANTSAKKYKDDLQNVMNVLKTDFLTMNAKETSLTSNDSTSSIPISPQHSLLLNNSIIRLKEHNKNDLTFFLRQFEQIEELIQTCKTNLIDLINK